MKATATRSPVPVLFVLLMACGRAVAPAPAAADPDAVDMDRGNLLSLARGASVVSRTAELTLETSAAHAIDGDWLTFWKSPGGGTDQTFVLALPARSRIDRVGVITSANAPEAPQFVTFAASDDGTTWRDVGTVAIDPAREPRLLAVPPFEANYLRAFTDENFDYYTTVRSFVAYGRELAPPAQPPVEGCWTINGIPSRFVRRGSSVAGVIGTDRPMYVSGGSDGRVLRLQWLRGPMWGPALIAIEPRRRALSGVRWHEEAKPNNVGDGWFGAPQASCGEIAIDETQIATRILRRAGKWIAYGDDALATMAALIERSPAQQLRVVARTAPRLEAARRALEARGIDLTRVEMIVAAAEATNEPQRVIADGVELHAR